MKKEIENRYRPLPFWSWNDELDPQELCQQIEWMHEAGIGGFFMHARGGLKTEYLGEKWFECVEACSKKAEELGMLSYAYDENGWPSGFCGGKLLEEEENHDRYLTYSIGEYDPKATVSYSLDGDKLVRAHSGKNNLNVYDHMSTSTADILDRKVVRKFLDSTHEEYKKRDTYHLKGFFTDEPQYHRWGTAFTHALPEYYKKQYGKDVYDGLGLLFVEKEGYRQFRYEYWKAMNELMHQNWAKQIYDWCEENHYLLTGHYVEENSLQMQMQCCAGIMPMYEYEHIPGMDYLGRSVTPDQSLASHQLLSVCDQLGKRQSLGELYGCCGWDVTPLQLKKIAESCYVDGLNLLCTHLLPYHEEGQRKRDYPAHYSSFNPWIDKGFREFNDYLSFLGKHIATSTTDPHVAVLHPIRSAYFHFKREDEEHANGVGELDRALKDLMNSLDAKHILWHFLDETLLREHGFVKEGKIHLGRCVYDTLILPKIYTMDVTTEQMIHEFVKQGGKILLNDEKPQYLEGKEYDYSYLNSNISLNEIVDALPFVSSENIQIRLNRRISDEGKIFYYVLNRGEQEESLFLQDKQHPSFEAVDLYSNTSKIVGNEIILQEGESLLLYPTEKKPEPNKKLSSLELPEAWDVVGTPDNYLTLDKASYSFDGKTYGKTRYVMALFDELLRRRYEGDLYVRYEFEVKDIPSHCLALVEDTNLLEVSINDKKVPSVGVSRIESHIQEFDIAPYLKEGKNVIVTKMHYFQQESVYYALYGENVTESLKNCLVYDSNIEAIYLKGNFGVDGDFEAGKVLPEEVILGDHFSLVKQKKHIASLILDGFPFFRGDVTLESEFDVTDTERELVLPSPYQIIDLTINGRKLGMFMFSKKIDISKYLVKGTNHIKMVLTVSNRNLLGESHTYQEENPSVYPDLWERLGLWEENSNVNYRDNYSFVKTLL